MQRLSGGEAAHTKEIKFQHLGIPLSRLILLNLNIFPGLPAGSLANCNTY